MINVIDKERNNFSFNKLGKRYDELSFEQQKTIAYIISYKIIIMHDQYNAWNNL